MVEHWIRVEKKQKKFIIAAEKTAACGRSSAGVQPLARPPDLVRRIMVGVPREPIKHVDFHAMLTAQLCRQNLSQMLPWNKQERDWKPLLVAKPLMTASCSPSGERRLRRGPPQKMALTPLPLRPSCMPAESAPLTLQRPFRLVGPKQKRLTFLIQRATSFFLSFASRLQSAMISNVFLEEVRGTLTVTFGEPDLSRSERLHVERASRLEAAEEMPVLSSPVSWQRLGHPLLLAWTLAVLRPWSGFSGPCGPSTDKARPHVEICPPPPPLPLPVPSQELGPLSRRASGVTSTHEKTHVKSSRSRSPGAKLARSQR